MNLLTWKIVLRQRFTPPGPFVPDAVVTVGPGFRHPGLPDEVGLLLPNRDCQRQLADALETARERFAGQAVGLFMADPFLNIQAEAARLTAAGVSWVANLPSVEQQDEEFSQQLADVGLACSIEIERLAAFRDAGFHILAVVTDAAGAAAAITAGPDALVVMPRIADFAAGFPSYRQRGTAIAAVVDAAGANDWSGLVLGLGTKNEADRETLWPAASDGLLCRPVPV